MLIVCFSWWGSAASTKTTASAITASAASSSSTAPPDDVRITFTRLPTEESRRRVKSRATGVFASIPFSQDGMPHCNHPIITTAPDADAVHANGIPGRGGKACFHTYPEAVGHILMYFATHRPPDGLCLNCFLYHDGTPCASPDNPWSLLFFSSHPKCPTCHQSHFPPCAPPLLK